MDRTKTGPAGLTLTSRDGGKSWTLLPQAAKNPAPTGDVGAWNQWSESWDSGPMSLTALAARFAAQEFQDSCEPRLFPSGRLLPAHASKQFYAAFAEAAE